MTRLYTVRKIDKLGRIVLPIEMRKVLNLDPDDFTRLSIEGNKIILEKQEPECCFCGEKENLRNYQNRSICRNCLKELKKISI